MEYELPPMQSDDRPHSEYPCAAVHALIPDYAFGLTDLDETRLVEANFSYCPEAAIQLAEYRRLQEAMRNSVPQIEPPAGLLERLMTATDEAEARATRR